MGNVNSIMAKSRLVLVAGTAVLLLLGALVLCGCNAEQHTLSGVWRASSGDSVTFRQDYTCTMNVGGVSHEATYAYNEALDSYVVTFSESNGSAESHVFELLAQDAALMLKDAGREPVTYSRYLGEAKGQATSNTSWVGGGRPPEGLDDAW